MGSLISCVAGRWRGGGRGDTGPFPIAAVLPRTKGGDAGGSPRGPRALGGAAAAGGGQGNGGASCRWRRVEG